MKQIIETKLVEQRTEKFVADDGTEFMGEGAEQKCKDYERRKDTEKCKREFEKLNPVYLDFPFANWGDECIVYKVHLENRGDLTKIIDYEENCSGDYFDNYLTEIKLNYPCDVVVYSNDNYVDAVTDIQNIIDRMTKTLEKLKA